MGALKGLTSPPPADRQLSLLLVQLSTFQGNKQKQHSELGITRCIRHETFQINNTRKKSNKTKTQYKNETIQILKSEPQKCVSISQMMTSVPRTQHHPHTATGYVTQLAGLQKSQSASML